MAQSESEELYDVIFTGKILNEFKESAVIIGMSRISSDIDPFIIAGCMQNGKAVIIKKELLKEDAENLVSEFLKIGAICVIHLSDFNGSSNKSKASNSDESKEKEQADTTEELYDVIFTGEVLDGFREANVLRDMSKILSIDPFDVVDYLASKTPIYIAENIPHQEAINLVSELFKIGAVCTFESSDAKENTDLGANEDTGEGNETSWWNKIKSLPRDTISEKIAALGIPGIAFVAAIATSGYYGGAAIVVALAAFGGPVGMLGGIGVMALSPILINSIMKYINEGSFKGDVDNLIKEGKSPDDIKKEINSYPISKGLKLKILNYLDNLVKENDL
ncbi:MAG: hypothetical protein HQL03_15260 [Nitrospirae bacterium]|nr:hypothetical protein [Nitrospirota bacterium]